MVHITKIVSRILFLAVCCLLLFGGASANAATSYGECTYNCETYQGVDQPDPDPGGGDDGGSSGGGSDSSGSTTTDGGSTDSGSQSQVDTTTDEPTDDSDSGTQPSPFIPDGSIGSSVETTKTLGFMDRWGKTLFGVGSAMLIFAAFIVFFLVVLRRRNRDTQPPSNRPSNNE